MAVDNNSSPITPKTNKVVWTWTSHITCWGKELFRTCFSPHNFWWRIQVRERVPVSRLDPKVGVKEIRSFWTVAFVHPSKSSAVVAAHLSCIPTLDVRKTRWQPLKGGSQHNLYRFLGVNTNKRCYLHPMHALGSSWFWYSPGPLGFPPGIQRTDQQSFDPRVSTVASHMRSRTGFPMDHE